MKKMITGLVLAASFGVMIAIYAAPVMRESQVGRRYQHTEGIPDDINARLSGLKTQLGFIVSRSKDEITELRNREAAGQVRVGLSQEVKDFALSALRAAVADCERF